MQDDRLFEYHKKVKTLAREFRALFMERISREDNMRADRLANEAIDEELQAVSSLSEYIDKEWMPMSQKHTATPVAVPTNLKIKPVASISPHVVKEHSQVGSPMIAKTTATNKPNSFSNNPSPRRLRSCNFSDENPRRSSSSDLDITEDCCNPNNKPAAKTPHLHVQTAAQQSRIKHGSYESVYSSSPTRRTASRTTPIAPLYHKSQVQVDSPEMSMNVMETLSTFSDESTGTSQLVDREIGGLFCSPEHDIANLSDASLSDSDEFSEANYEKLVRTILKGYFYRKKSYRS